MIILVLISNIYNTTPNKQIIISYILDRQKINKKKLHNSFNNSNNDKSINKNFIDQIKSHDDSLESIQKINKKSKTKLKELQTEGIFFK